MKPVQPAGGASVGLAQAGLGLLLASLGPYVLLLADELHRPRQQLAWLPSTFGAGLILVAAVGLLAREARAALVLRVAAATLAAGATAAALARSMPLAATGALLIGVGGAGVVLATPSLLRGPGAAGRLARVTGASSAAGIAAPLLIAAVEKAGPHGRLALLAPVPALVVVALWPVAPPRTVPGPPGHRAPRRQLWAGWLCVVLAVSAEFCFTFWGAARLRDAGAPPATAAALSVAFPLGMAAGRLAVGRTAQRPWAVAGACLTALTGTAIVCATDAVWSTAAGLGVAGFGTAMLYPIHLARLAATPHLSAGRSAALGALASGTAITTAPLLLAAVSTAVGLRIAFVLPSLLLAALLLLSSRARTTGPVPEA
ncbi:MAG TPA: hypothetical protein VGN37_26370 [Actinocatenispora sp.]